MPCHGLHDQTRSFSPNDLLLLFSPPSYSLPTSETPLNSVLRQPFAFVHPSATLHTPLPTASWLLSCLRVSTPCHLPREVFHGYLSLPTPHDFLSRHPILFLYHTYHDLKLSYVFNNLFLLIFYSLLTNTGMSISWQQKLYLSIFLYFSNT